MSSNYSSIPNYLRKNNYNNVLKEKLSDLDKYDKKVVKIVPNLYDPKEEIAIEFTPRNNKKTFSLSEIFQNPGNLGTHLSNLGHDIKNKNKNENELDKIREQLEKQIEVPLTQELVDDIKFIRQQLEQKTKGGGKRKSRRNKNPKKLIKGKSSRRSRRSRKTSRR